MLFLIKGFSPDSEFLYFYLHSSCTRKQPDKAGLYEYNMRGDHWRHIAHSDFQFVLLADSNYAVLLKNSDGKFFLHEVESFDVNPVKLPEEIYQLIPRASP